MKWFLISAILLSSFYVHGQAIDSVAIKQVDSLISLNRDLIGKRKYKDALAAIEEAEKLSLSFFGRQSATMAKCLHNHAWTLQNWDKKNEAESFYLESIEIKKKTIGKDHPDNISTLNNLALLYKDMGKYNKAEPLYGEAKAIVEKVLGKEHPDYAKSFSNLCILYSDMGNNQKAEPFCLEAKEIVEKILGKEHPDYINSLNNLATLYFRMGNSEKAESLYLEASAIRKKVLGKEHPDYAKGLASLGSLYVNIGNYVKAEILLFEAKAIYEQVLGKENRDYALNLNNLGVLYKEIGNYQKAEPMYIEAKAIWEKVLGKEHPDYAMSLNNLANLYWLMGNFEKAGPLYIEAKDIREKVLGKEHRLYARSVTNLAIFYNKMGNYEKAEPLFLEGLAIKEKALGKEHPDYASSLHNLAVFYGDLGYYDKAESLYINAKSIREKVLGRKHPQYTESVNNLAIIYLEMGKYEKAEPLFLEALAIREEVLGKEHTLYTECLFNLSILYEYENKYPESQLFAKEYFKLTQIQLKQSTTFLSENELSKYVATFQKNGDLLTSQLLSRQKKKAPINAFSELSYDETLFRKGFLLTNASRLNVLSSSSNLADSMSQLLKIFRSRLAAQYMKPIKERKDVDELEDKANTTEKELARMISGYEETSTQVNWQQVQNSLKPTEAAIEFISFKLSFPKNTDSTMYAALLLKPGMIQPEFISLFEEKIFREILQSNMNHPNSEMFAILYSRGATPISTINSQEGLYNLCWQPLDSLLHGIRTIYYSPSGLLHQINFDAIPIEKGITLSDRYKLVRLGSTRSLVIPDQIKVNTSNEVVLYGGIQYEIDTTQLIDDTIPDLIKSTTAEISFANADRSVPQRGDNWNYLPGTEKEVKEITNITKKSKYPHQIFSGKFATEESFKNLGKGKESPRVIHLATHGFFFPDVKDTTQHSNSLGEQPAFKISDHPMIRSGLLLSGANLAWKTGKPWKEGMEDGILTAYEISQMNLSNTELVVLSACETGLGDIQGNEGVYGLQRAFKIAGVKYLIMSLWQIPDEETKEFMISFYKNWLNKQMTIPDAFRNTQKEMQKRYTNPYLWAGFVLVE